MKVKELLEDIVNLAQAREKRDQQRQETQKQQDVEQSYDKLQKQDQAETTTVQELAEFEEWMNVAKKKGRVPGFESMDDVVAYLLSDVDSKPGTRPFFFATFIHSSNSASS